MKVIRLSKSCISKRENAVIKVLNKGLGMGPVVKKFRQTIKIFF